MLWSSVVVNYCDAFCMSDQATLIIRAFSMSVTDILDKMFTHELNACKAFFALMHFHQNRGGSIFFHKLLPDTCYFPWSGTHMAFVGFELIDCCTLLIAEGKLQTQKDAHALSRCRNKEHPVSNTLFTHFF